MNASKPKTDTARARPALDRQKIAATTLELIDAKGIDHVSMRSIGAALEVEAMALYYYYGNKTELLDGVRDYLLDELVKRIDGAGKPITRIRNTFEALRAIGLEHPDVIPTFASGRFRSDRALQFYEDVLRSLREAGLSPAQSARYFGLLSQLTFGSCLFAAGTHDAPSATPEIDDLARKYPHVNLVNAHTDLQVREQDFRFGLDLILHSLKAERME